MENITEETVTETQGQLIQEEEPKATILASFALDWNIVRAISLFASEDQTRYVLNGVLFSLEEGFLTVCATDGRRLSAYRLAMDYMSLDAPIDAIMGNELISKIKLGRQKLPVKIVIKRYKGKVIFRVSDALDFMAFEGHAVDGNYPNWRQVTPKGMMTPDVRVHVNPEYLSDYAKARTLLKSERGLRLLSEEGTEKGVSPFVVDLGIPEFVGVLMPMRDANGERFDYQRREWAVSKSTTE